MSTTPHLLRGERDQYRLLEFLDDGAFGMVFKGVSTSGRTVAVKVLKRPADSDARERFVGELSILYQLDHPNVVDVLDHGVDAEQRPFYVMEWIADGTAAHVASRERDWSEVRGITRDVADALAAYHALGGIHRDVKPENVLMDNGHAVLADFGVARCPGLTGQAMTRGPNGTMPYMAPEMYRNEAGQASDVYALGVMFWELVHGWRWDPDLPGTPPEDFPVEAPLEIRQLYFAMVQRDPNFRPSAAEVVGFIDAHWPIEIDASAGKSAPPSEWEVIKGFLTAAAPVAAAGALIGIAAVGLAALFEDAA